MEYNRIKYFGALVVEWKIIMSMLNPVGKLGNF